MSDKKLSNEPTLDNSTIDTADLIYVADVSASQTKGITNANLMSPKASTFRVVDSSDLTKKVALDVSGVSTATTRTLTVPDANTTIVGTDTTQNLTNKSLGAGTKINTSGSDVAGSMYYRDASGNLVPFSGTSSQIVSFDGSGIPTAIPNPAASNASTTVKGVIEIATTAEVTTGTATGGTGAILVVPASAVGAPGASTLVQFDGSGKYPVADGSAITNLTLPFHGVFKNGDTTKNAGDASATQTIAHGLGYTPKRVNITCTGTSAGTAGAGRAFISRTVYNGTTQSSQSTYLGSSGIFDNTFTIDYSGTNSGGQSGVVTFDATNIYIVWTKNNIAATGIYTLVWEAQA